MSFEKEYLINKIKNMSNEDTKDLLFSIRWGFLSLNYIEEIRKAEEQKYRSYLKTLQLPYVLDKNKLSEEDKLEVIKYEEKIKLLRYLESECKK